MRIAMLVIVTLAACGPRSQPTTEALNSQDLGAADDLVAAGDVQGGPCGVYGALCCGLGQGQAGTCLDGSACVLDSTGYATLGTGCIGAAPTLGCQICDHPNCGKSGAACCLTGKACRDGSECSDTPAKQGSDCR